MTNSSPDPKTSLTATYQSPTSAKSFEYALSNSATSARQGTAEKTAYLSELRSSVTVLQNDINAFLTRKMEEDKAASGEAAAMQNMEAAKEAELDDDGPDGEDVSDS